MKHALRRLLQTPGFTVIAVLTLALGLGASTTVFSWIERVLLNPLPGVADSGRIVALESLTAAGTMIDSSYPDFRDCQAGATTLSDVIAFKERPLSLGGSDHPERLFAEFVSANFFDALGIRPVAGRFFSPDDRADTAAAPVVVLSEDLWRRRFHADPKLIGATVRLNAHPLTVIGIAPASFLGSMNGLAFGAWIPLPLYPQLTGSGNWLEDRGSRPLHLLGRLAPTATLPAAQAELAALSHQLAAAHPKSNRTVGIAVVPLLHSPHGIHAHLARPLLLLLGICALLLLIVGANLSNLLFVRASARQREMCIRQALGASWFALARQLLAESLLLSLAGAGLGLVLTLWLADALAYFLPGAGLPLALTASLDARVVLVALALSILTTLLAGLAPALWIARPEVASVLRTAGRGATVSPRAEFLRNGLVVFEVATALVTLACAGLVAKSFAALRSADPGFTAQGVLLAGLNLEANGYSRDDGVAFLDALREKLSALPGVDAVAFAEDVPLGLDGGSWEDIAVPGHVPAADENMKIYRNLVSPGYFSLLRLPLLAGREFTDADRRDAPPVAIVNETFVRRYFNGADAVSRTFSLWGGRRQLTIVGVARDGPYHRFGESPAPYFYVPLRQFFRADTGVAVHLRTRHDPLALLPAVRRAVQSLDPEIVLFDTLTLEDYISVARHVQKVVAAVLGILSGLCVLLAALGLYGVLAFATAQRTPEIGVRLALGASHLDILRLVALRGCVLLSLGLTLGLLAAVGAGRLLAHGLYGIGAFEPALLAATVVAIAAIALVACWLPAHRATRVDPIVALRAE